MTDKIEVKQLDQGFNLSFTNKTKAGTARDISGYTVTLKVWDPDDYETLVIEGDCTIDDAENGPCHYELADGDVDDAKIYEWELELTAGGIKESSLSGEFIVYRS